MKTTKPLKDRLGKRLLDQLHTRKITNKEAAEQLGVSESYLSRTVAAFQDKVPGPTVLERKANSELARIRRQYRTKLAKDVIRNRTTIAEAANAAGCSERTMFRYVAQYTAQPEAKAPKKAKKVKK